VKYAHFSRFLRATPFLARSVLLLISLPTACHTLAKDIRMLGVAPVSRRSFVSSMDAYFRDVKVTSVLTPSEEKTLCARVQQGDSEARDHLIRANLRLVVSIAKSYSRGGIDLEDAIAEGNLGLIRAAEAFDPEMETRFCTYAAYWIKQAIKRLLINTSRPIRVPAYMNELMCKWQRAKKQLQEELDHTPTFEEIAAHLQLTPRKMALVKKAIRIYNASPSTGRQDAADVDQLFVDANSAEPGAALLAREDLGQVMQMLDTLDEREAKVLRLRFGLDGDEPMTLSEIGVRLDLTRERVRQIEREALNQLAEKLAS
jgi:RNA polymerase primary sigma factor